jgi:hypothetical protein
MSAEGKGSPATSVWSVSFAIRPGDGEPASGQESLFYPLDPSS